MNKQEITDSMWEQIKTEYITQSTSYRKLAEKYGIPFSRIRARGQAGGWIEERNQNRRKTVQKSVDAISDYCSEQIVKAHRIGNLMLDKIEQSLESLQPDDRQGLKQLTSALKDLKEMKIFVNEMDKREQEARINKLRKDAEDEQKDSTITIVMEGVDKYVV